MLVLTLPLSWLYYDCYTGQLTFKQPTLSEKVAKTIWSLVGGPSEMGRNETWGEEQISSKVWERFKDKNTKWKWHVITGESVWGADLHGFLALNALHARIRTEKS